MKTTPAYYRYVPWFLGIGFLLFAVDLFAQLTDSYNPENRQSGRSWAYMALDWLGNSANSALLWWIIGRLTDKRREALITIACCVALQLVWELGWASLHYNSPGYFFLRLTYALPFLIFSLLAFRKIGFAWLFSSIAVIGISLVYSGNYQIENHFHDFLARFDLENAITWTISESENSRQVINLMSMALNLFIPIVEFVLIAEWFLRQSCHEKPLAPRLLRLNQYCPKGAATLIFYAFRLSLYALAFGFGNLLLSSFQMPEEYRPFWAMFGLRILTGFGLLYFILWYLRKFLAEYFLTRYAVPAWGFWALNIPIFDLLLWPLIGLTKPAPMPATERLAFFDEAQSSGAALPLKYFILGAQIFYLVVLVLLGSPLSAVGVTALSVVLYVVYLFNPHGFWALAGLLFLSLLTLVYFLVDRSMARDAGQFILPYIFYTFSFIYVMMAAFHLPVFSAVADENAIAPPSFFPENDNILDAPLG